MSTSSQPVGIGMYPSWYARYLLAFNNQLRCRERVHDLRHRLISEEQRYLDQASDRVREFVLAGKHTVRPVMGDQSPRNQPTRSLPVTNKVVPKRLPLLRPQQGQAAPVEGTGNSLEITRHRRRNVKKRKKARTPSPQYPTFCVQELVVRAEAEARRDARMRGMLRGPASSPVDMVTVAETTTDDDDIPLPLTLMEYYLEPDNIQGDGSNISRRGPFVETKSSRNGLQKSPEHSGKLPKSDHAAMETEPYSSPETIEIPLHRHPRFDFSDSCHSPDDPPTVESSPALNGSSSLERNLADPGRISKSPRDVSLQAERYFESEISPGSASSFKTRDGPESRQRRSNASEPDMVIEYSDRLIPKESFPVEEDGAPSKWKSPDEARRKWKPDDDDRRKQRRKESHRKHLRKMNRANGCANIPDESDYLTANTDKIHEEEGNKHGSIRHHGNARPSNKNGSFPEIEAVRRWQLIGQKGRNKINKSMRRYSHRDEHT